MKFITDLGSSLAVDPPLGEITHLHQYGVWGNGPKGKPEVIETSDDLKYLQHKYDIPDNRIATIGGKNGK